MPDDHAAVTSLKRKSPVLAMVLSGIFPGLGQLYNAEKLKAVIFAVAGLATAAVCRPGSLDVDPSAPAAALRGVLLASLPFLGVAVWSVVDAYRVARRSGRSGPA